MTAGIFAILLGLGGAYTVRQYLSQEEPVVAEEEEQKPQIRAVPLAAYDLPPGKPIADKDIIVVGMTAKQIGEKWGTTPYFTKKEDIIGRVLMGPLKAQELFQPTNFYPEGYGPGIAERLKPGLVAVTVPVDNLAMVAGFVRPGTYVDLIFRALQPQEVTMTLLDHIEVLAVGPSFLPDAKVSAADNDRQKEGMVTVAVTPYQAQVLKAAEGRGDISLTLRNPSDVGLTSGMMVGESERIRLAQLLGLPTGIQRKTMEVYQGGKLVTVEFDRQFTFDQTQYIQTPVAERSTPRDSQLGNFNRRAPQWNTSQYRTRSITQHPPINPDSDKPNPPAATNAATAGQVPETEGGTAPVSQKPGPGRFFGPPQ